MLGAERARAELMRRKLTDAMQYPAFVLIAALGVMLFFILFVLPQFSAVLQDFGAKSDSALSVFIKLSEFLRANAAVMMLVVASSVAGAWWLPRAPMFECTIRADGEEIRLTAMVVLVVNAGMLGAAPFRFGPNIAIDDGWLDICVYRPRTALERAGVLWRILRQRSDGQSMMQRKARSVEIKAPDVLWHEVDGDVHRGNVLRAEIVPGGVRVVA